MTRRNGLWLTFTEGHKLDDIDAAIAANNAFTAVIPKALKPRVAELAIISRTGESADYICVARASSRVATGERRISLVNLVDLGEIPIKELQGILSKRFSNKIFWDQPVNRPGPVQWVKILDAVVSLRPPLAAQIAGLRALVAEFEGGNLRRPGGLEVFERDAVASAIQIFGGTKLRKRVLRSTAPANDQAAPFLSRLKNVSVREDPQIIHDAATFPGMRVAHRYIVGAVELDNDRGERLTILHCNRLKLEETLGVDLIYYAHAYSSFVLIQYKRMTGHSHDTMAYRPGSDRNYQSELDRMTKVEQMLVEKIDSQCASLNDFRLSTQSIFFKLCEAKAKAALDEGMVSGMYIPLGLWTQFMRSDASQGKRGGTMISWRNAPRHFSNGEFTALLQRGWIGSSGTQSKYLEDIVEAVLDSSHSLFFAITRAAMSGRDYLRDSQGRFTEEDDPTAAR